MAEGGDQYQDDFDLLSALMALQISKKKHDEVDLPITGFKEQLLETIKKHQIVVVIGETGSGKTTQIPQYLARAGYAEEGRIACTQPRRVAAITVARKVAQEYGCRIGAEVGFKIRFEDKTGEKTKIKYMTDGMLLRECINDPSLDQYSFIILDEAHERGLHTDVLFGLIKKVARVRRDLKIIVTSATLDADKFSKYFDDAPVFTIPGRSFPVETFYRQGASMHYLDAALNTVMEIHQTQPDGDILLFLTGQDDIDIACENLENRMGQSGSLSKEMVVLPMYAALPASLMKRVFEPAPSGGRKVIVATNIAETSLTIVGVTYVVDTGFTKQKIFSFKTGIEELAITPISQSQAKQRAGRAGRTNPGKCYRLYTKAAFTGMLPMSIPEIQRVNLASTVLNLNSIGIEDILNFDFMDQPDDDLLHAAIDELVSLSALDQFGHLTDIGRRMSAFPLDPKLAKMLITSIDLRCSDEVITIIAMLSGTHVFYRPKKKQVAADRAKAQFNHPDGDHLSLLKVYEAFEENSSPESWGYDNYINAKTMSIAQDVRLQLVGIMNRRGHPMEKAGHRGSADIRKAICSGFYRNAARRTDQFSARLRLKVGSGDYDTIPDMQQVAIHPSSTVKERRPAVVVYNELVKTTKPYMRNITIIEEVWLNEFGPVANVKLVRETEKQRQLSRRRTTETQNSIQRLKSQRQGFCPTDGSFMFDKHHFDRHRPYNSAGPWVP